MEELDDGFAMRCCRHALRAIHYAQPLIDNATEIRDTTINQERFATKIVDEIYPEAFEDYWQHDVHENPEDGDDDEPEGDQ